MSDVLKPCPFCGAIPDIFWEPWREISEDAGAYVLEANHTHECFIVRMNGMNFRGRMTSFNKDSLIDAWNRRVDNE